MLNKDIKRKQQWYFIIVLAVIGVVVLAIIAMMTLGHRHKKSKPSPNLTGLTTNTDFVHANQESVILRQQQDMDALRGKLTQLQSQIGKMRKTQAQMDQSLASTKALAKQSLEKVSTKSIPDHKHSTQFNGLNHNTRTQGSHSGNMPMNNVDALGGSQVRAMPSQVGIQMQSFVYQDTTIKIKRTSKNYVPSGSFAKAVILGGADADASVNGQSNTTELLFRILDNGTLPGGKHSHLKDCTALASVYGDISSERGIVRLQSLSCTLKHGRILDIPVKGWAFYSGKSGIKGVPVMRNGKILAWAGLSGMLGGIGQSLSQSQSTQSVSALGTSNSVPPSRIASSGLYGGAGTALNKLANYYIKRADQYHPIIEIGAGNIVTLVFERGFYLDPDHKPVSQHIKEDNAKSSKEVSIPKSLLQQIQHSHMGQEIGERNV